MDRLGSDHVGPPRDPHAITEELCFLCVVRAASNKESVFAVEISLVESSSVVDMR
jgi:hypothetical protein